MHPIFYYIIPYILLGVIGMVLGGRKAPAQERYKRWQKLIVYIAIILGVIVCILAHGHWFLYFSLILLGLVFLELLWVASQHKLSYTTYLSPFLLYCVIAIGFGYAAAEVSKMWLLLGYFIVITFDGFSQISGQLFGKTPFFQYISPNKTLEGFIGGTFSGLTAAILARDWVNLSFYQAILVGLASVALALVGDLTASYYKRIHQVKDFSQLLPGQGGFTDRFDSYLWVGAAYGYFALFS